MCPQTRLPGRLWERIGSFCLSTRPQGLYFAMAIATDGSRVTSWGCREPRLVRPSWPSKPMQCPTSGLHWVWAIDATSGSRLRFVRAHRAICARPSGVGCTPPVRAPRSGSRKTSPVCLFPSRQCCRVAPARRDRRGGGRYPGTHGFDSAENRPRAGWRHLRYRPTRRR
jgi:hypothetical protein